MKTLNFSNSTTLNTKVSENGYKTIIKMSSGNFHVELDEDGNDRNAVYSNDGDYLGFVKNGRFYKEF